MNERVRKNMTEWHEELFDERYLVFYEEVLTQGLLERDVEFIDKALTLRQGARVLDLGCGVGRHAIPMAKLGYHVTGLERSDVMIGHARRRALEEGVQLELVQRDMRELDGLGPFDACLCLYTVFGYFEDPVNESVLSGIWKILRDEGTLVLDVTNPLSMMPRWPGERWREISRGVAREYSSYDALTGRLRAQRKIYWSEGGREDLPDSVVRMYLPHELRGMLERCGFEIEQLHGDLRGSPFRWKRSAQQVWVARKITGPSPGR